MVKAQIISGEFGKILARQKSDQGLELGELLCAEQDNRKLILQVTELLYGSQFSQQNLELISGMKLDDDEELKFFEPHLRNYTLATLKPLVALTDGNAKLCKELPAFFSEVREVTKADLTFLTKPKNSISLGKLRSGSKTLDVDISLDGNKVLAHHILVAGTTGRGKSTLLNNILWNLIDKNYCGMLVLDPHDEYYGRNSLGMKDHKSKDKVSYYTPSDPPPGAFSLKINFNSIKPIHFRGVINWSDPQLQCLNAYYKKYREKWIESIVLEKSLDVQFHEATVSVVRRRMMSLLDLNLVDNRLHFNGIFHLSAGTNTIDSICSELEEGKTVIIDTSSFSGSVEILIGSLVATELLTRYKRYKKEGSLFSKPVVSIVLEEAPRVLGKEVLEQGQNIFSTIAREGRKFKVGLTAITQLPSLIPRQILANMNTKIILGIEMQPERQAIIDSASQDLSSDSRTIASLDVGEAIVTSNFSKFALPIKIPRFEGTAKVIKKEQQEYKQDFEGVKL